MENIIKCGEHEIAIPLEFPVDAETFIAYQEELSGFKLPQRMREVTAFWVDVLNQIYQLAHEGDKVNDEAYTAIQGYIDKYDAAGQSAGVRLYKSVYGWMKYAEAQGLRDCLRDMKKAEAADAPESEEGIKTGVQKIE